MHNFFSKPNGASIIVLKKGKITMARILVIDDDPQIRGLLRQMLVSEGYAVADAGNGKEAVEIQAREPADVIITDMIMPKKGGIETIRELTSVYPGVKIIAMSGGGLMGAADHLTLPKRMGVRHTLTKPVARDKMLSAIKDLLA